MDVVEDSDSNSCRAVEAKPFGNAFVRNQHFFYYFFAKQQLYIGSAGAEKRVELEITI